MTQLPNLPDVRAPPSGSWHAVRLPCWRRPRLEPRRSERFESAQLPAVRRKGPVGEVFGLCGCNSGIRSHGASIDPPPVWRHELDQESGAAEVVVG